MPEPTIVYLLKDETSAPVPFLYSRDVPAFSGLTEKEYLDLYRDDAKRVVLPQDLPTLQNMDGYEASRIIRSSVHPDAKKVPIIALSADAYAGDVRKTREYGMNGHLSKPVDPELVYSTLYRYICKAD